MSKNIKIGGEVINGVKALRVESADEEGVLIQFPDEGGTIVYVNGQAVAIFDADTKLDKQTGVTSNAQAYVKWADGTQTMVTLTSSSVAGSIPLRATAGQLILPDQSDAVPSLDQAISKRFADGRYLAKQTDATTYPQVYQKAADGTQEMVESSPTARYNALVRRTNTAQIVLPNQATYEPIQDEAISRRWANARFTGARYIHTVSIFLVMTNNESYTVTTRFIDSASTPVTDPQALYDKNLLGVIAEEGHDPDGTLFFGAMLVRGRYAQQSAGLGLMMLKHDGTTVYISRLVSGYDNVSTCSITDTVTAF